MKQPRDYHLFSQDQDLCEQIRGVASPHLKIITEQS